MGRGLALNKTVYNGHEKSLYTSYKNLRSLECGRHNASYLLYMYVKNILTGVGIGIDEAYYCQEQEVDTQKQDSPQT